jgi:hypothetical protein
MLKFLVKTHLIKTIRIISRRNALNCLPLLVVCIDIYIYIYIYIYIIYIYIYISTRILVAMKLRYTKTRDNC